jgi:predicted RNA binding protein YcfA (HicA-like mRNA interferase family)
MIVVPAHRPIGKGMVRTIMREADVSVDEFNRLTD